GCVAMVHFWYGASGVPTLKNDAMHGVGFVLMTLVIVRASRAPLLAVDGVLLAVGAVFGSVKYTGIFEAVIASAVVLFLRRRDLRTKHVWAAIAAAVFFLLTSGHYYL